MEKDQKISIVTGAGTGGGKSASLALADEGWTIVLAGRRKDPIEAVANEIKSRGGNASAIVTDTSDTKSVKGLFEETKRAFGRLDLLFNNAGTNAPGVSLEDLSFEQWTNVVNVNLTGVFLCTQEAFRLMKAQTPMGGRIINNGSISAHVPRPGSAPYTATMPNGVDGQIKVLIFKTDGGHDVTITPVSSNIAGVSTSIVMGDAGDAVILMYVDAKWYILGQFGCTIS